MLGTSTWSPPKSLAWQKGSRLGSGLIVRLLGVWLGVSSLLLLASALGIRLVVLGGILCRCPLAAAAFFSCQVEPERWIVSHFAVKAHFDCSRWICWATQPVHRAPLGPAFWLPAVDRGRSSKSVEVLRVWEIYDDRLQFMKWSDALLLRDCLMRGDVTAAWLVWSAAAEEALADAFRLAGGSVPDKGLVLGRGCVRGRAVTLGGPRIRRLGVMLVMLWMLGMCSCIGTLPLLLCLTFVAVSRFFWMFLMH